MKLLLDTHTFLWLLNAPEKLSEQALAACKSLENQLFFSVVVAWEIQIKRQLGKLARVESCQLVTSDSVIPTYSVAVLW